MMQESSSRMETVYDKLNKLNAEIAEGIVQLSDTQPEVTHRQLNSLREQAYKERSPEAVFATVLFRKYASIATEFKGSKLAAGDGKSTLIGELPSFVFEKDDDNMLVGWEATKTNIFRIRALATLFALLTFAVMSSVPYVTEADFFPEHHFNVECQFNGLFSGKFNFRPYELTIAVGVLAFVFNLAQMWYYWLPVDVNRQKYVPGGTEALTVVVGQRAYAEEKSNSICGFFRTHYKFLDVCSDAVLLLLGVIAFVVSQYVLDSVVRTTVWYAGAGNIVQYYTLSSLYETFSDVDCLDKGLNPTPSIRGALAMLFFLCVFLLLNFLVSLRAFRQDPDAQMLTVPSMAGFSRLRGGSPGPEEAGSTRGGEAALAVATTHPADHVAAGQQGNAMRMVVTQEEMSAAGRV